MKLSDKIKVLINEINALKGAVEYKDKRINDLCDIIEKERAASKPWHDWTNGSRVNAYKFKAELEKLFEQQKVIGMFAVIQYEDGRCYPHAAGGDFMRMFGVATAYFHHQSVNHMEAWAANPKTVKERSALEKGL